MPGFLDDADLQVVRGDEGAVRQKRKAAAPKVFTCAECGLDQNCQTPYFPVWGKGKKRIMFVLDTPSLSEDEKGYPWRGEVGKTLRKNIEQKFNLDFERDCFTTYAVKCCARKTTTSMQVTACRKRLHDEIRECDPLVIIPFGYWAMQGISGDILTSKAVGKNSTEWAGEQIPDQRFLKWICPTFEVSYFNQDGPHVNNTKDIMLEYVFQHIQGALNIMNEPVIMRDDNKRVKIIYEPSKAIAILQSLYNQTEAIRAFDYETTGRKPYRKGHEIYTLAISDGFVSYAMPMFENEFFRSLWHKCLRSPRIKWIAHNAKFEWNWTKEILGYYPRNLLADTMIAAHTENNHKRVGLKPLTYCKFGVAGYEDEIQHFLEASSAEEKMFGGNAFNNIKQAPLDKILLYNGLDPLYTMWLYRYYTERLPKKQQSAWHFFDDVSTHFARAENRGLVVNAEASKKRKAEIKIKLANLETSIQQQAMDKGWDRGKAFRPSAGPDIAHLLFDIMGCKTDEKTATGNMSTDKTVLGKINAPIVRDILEWKKFTKLNDTYIEGVIREGVDGIVHPFFNLTTVTTYRTSSDSPNFQNFPKRDKEIFDIIRSLLFPHPGQKLGEYDYKAIEVAANACINKDPNLIKYVTDPTTDMHRDTGEEIYLYNRGELPKFDRGIAKNKFVFPEFYGSFFENCARDLWDYCSKETKLHLKEKGFRNLSDFTEHIESIEKLFWKKRFPVYAQWRKDIYAQYLKKGYIDSPTGFRYYGPMTKNECCNAQAQGGACHVLIWTFTEVSKQIEKERMKSRLIGQIHDSAIPSIEPDEEHYLDSLFYHFGTKKVRERFDWIIVPLQLEKAIGGIDEPWSKLEEVGLLGSQIPVDKLHL